MELRIISPVQNLLRQLMQAGHEAFLVGGCLRDSLLGTRPNDWDVTTSATPGEVQALFASYCVIDTRVKHGTVTVITEGVPIEVTTYRQSAALADDLAHRDFTLNALAYHIERGLIDPHNGREDLQKGLIRSVGNAADRFHEDGLRVLRALRFAASLGFTIEESTSREVRRCQGLLLNIAVEGLWQEYRKLVCGKDMARVLLAYPEVIAQFIPEIKKIVGFDQRNPHHIYDVYEHTVRAMSHTPPEPVLRITMFFHDIGKPATYSVDRDGVGHFYGHPQVSAEIAEKVLIRLRCSWAEREEILALIKYHDVQMKPAKQSIQHWLAKLPEQTFRKLLLVKLADSEAQNPLYRNRYRNAQELSSLLEQVLAEGSCCQPQALGNNVSI